MNQKASNNTAPQLNASSFVTAPINSIKNAVNNIKNGINGTNGKNANGTDSTGLLNTTAMQRLHNGAIWQQYEKTERLANAMYELAKVAVGEEKANEILEQNEIKLLN